MEATECGAASLGMVLEYFGKHVPLEKLRVACGIGRDGSNAPGLMKAAREYGLIPHGYRKEPVQLGELDLPQIIYWKFNHFLVIEGFDEKYVHLNDPERGRVRVSHEEFDSSFTGVVLTFEKGPDFVADGTRESVFRRLIGRLGAAKSAFAYFIVAGMALVIPGLVVPTLTKIFIDDFLIGQRPNAVPPLLVGLGVGAVLIAGLTWLQQHYLLRLQTKLSIRMTGQFIWHVLQLPMSFFSQRSTGDIAMRVGLNDQVSAMLAGQFTTNLLNIFTALFFAAMMFYFDPVLAAVSMVLASLNFVALRLINRRTGELNDKVLRDTAHVQSTSITGLATIETLKSSGTDSDFFARFSGLLAKSVNARQAVDVPAQTLAAVPTFLAALTGVAVLGLGGYRVIQGDLTVGTLVAFQTLLASFLMPVNGLVGLGGQLRTMESNVARLDDVLNYQVDAPFQQEEPKSSNGHRAKLSGKVEIDTVTFGYNRLQPALIEGFTATLTPGQRIAIVGASGSGKSTTARVVSGLYPAWAGDVRFDGTSRQDFSRYVLGNSVALVDQEIAMFPGTIRDNLTLWDSTLSEEDMIEAARDAEIHDDIVARPGGYSSTVDENGRNFSGGQRQRLEIARALVRNPAILVLDEATSALDPLTEVRIDRNLRRRGCTCLIIAHRLSTIRDADEIVVLEQGVVVQRGTHEELKSIEGHYANLVGAESG
jgi:NHLM bacteriocin system ABC transporter peptidase/ATP-binding protein